MAPKARQNTMGPARSVSFMMLPSATFMGCSTVRVFCQMWSKLIPSSVFANTTHGGEMYTVFVRDRKDIANIIGVHLHTHSV